MGFLARANLTLIFLSLAASGQEKVLYNGCDPAEYYSSFNSTITLSELENLLYSTHRRKLPYTGDTSGGDDVWKALIELDAGDEPETVRLIYRQVDMAASAAGETTGWNREHLWPKSLGVGIRAWILPTFII
jgi:hypothetical protein